MRKPIPFRCRAHVWLKPTADWSLKLDCELQVNHNHGYHVARLESSSGMSLLVHWLEDDVKFEPFEPDPEPHYFDDMAGPPMGATAISKD